MKEIEVQGHRYAVAEYNAEFQIDNGERMLRIFMQSEPDVSHLTNEELNKRFAAWQKKFETASGVEARRLERDMIFEPIGDAPLLSELMQTTKFTNEEASALLAATLFFRSAAADNSPEPASSTTSSKNKSAQRAAFGKGSASRSPRKTIKRT